MFVPKPIKLLHDLFDAVKELDLNNGLKNSLLNRVTQAISILNDDNPNNGCATIGMLSAFINLLEAQSGKKIDELDVVELIDITEDILELLGC